MCFIVGIVKPAPDRVEEELLGFRYFANENPDGWGIGWYSSSKPVVFKRVNNAIKDPVFLRTASSIISHIVIGHLRAKTRGNLREVNTHPFLYRNYIFVHNGTLDKEPLEKELKGEHRNVRGDTDSERLFHFLMQYMEKFGAVHGMRRALKRINRLYEKAYVSYINIMISDGEHFFAFTKHFRSRKQGLHYLLRDGFSPEVIVATEPITREPGWVKMKSGTLLIVDSRNMDVRFTEI